MNYLYALAVSMLVIIGVEQYGEHRVQSEWDKDVAIRQALIDKAKQENKESLDEIRKQYEKDKRAATSKAGRDAIARYIRERGLLQEACAGNVQAQGSKGVNGISEEPRTSAALESFAGDCASDALKVIRWQELCKANRCEVE
jgi:hypothetical protein